MQERITKNYNNINLRAVRSVGEVVDVSMRFLFRHGKLLLKMVATIALPPMIFGFLLSTFFQFRAYGNLFNSVDYTGLEEEANASIFSSTTGFSVENLALSYVFLIFVGVGMAAVTGIVIELLRLIDKGDNDITARKIFNGIITRIKIYFGSLVGLYSLFIISFLPVAIVITFVTQPVVMVLVVLIYMFVALKYFIRFSMLFHTQVFNNLGFVNGLSKSMELTKPYWWKTLGLVLLTGVLIFSLLAFPMYLSQIGLAFGFMLESEFLMLVLFAQVLYVFTYSLSQIIYTLAISFHYFNLVERKEGIGLLRKIEELHLLAEQPEQL